jgi:hypothetical protein
MKWMLVVCLSATMAMAQQRVEFHAADLQSHWIPWSQNGVRMGVYQKIMAAPGREGKIPEVLFPSLYFDDWAGKWEIFLTRVHDDRGLSWQNRELLYEGEHIDIDASGKISVEWKGK